MRFANRSTWTLQEKMFLQKKSSGNHRDDFTLGARCCCCCAQSETALSDLWPTFSQLSREFQKRASVFLFYLFYFIYLFAFWKNDQFYFWFFVSEISQRKICTQNMQVFEIKLADRCTNCFFIFFFFWETKNWSIWKRPQRNISISRREQISEQDEKKNNGKDHRKFVPISLKKRNHKSKDTHSLHLLASKREKSAVLFWERAAFYCLDAWTAPPWLLTISSVVEPEGWGGGILDIKPSFRNVYPRQGSFTTTPFATRWQQDFVGKGPLWTSRWRSFASSSESQDWPSFWHIFSQGTFRKGAKDKTKQIG